jgi:septal ring factor EnvC (AmiA/AmiB activator)
MNDTIIKHKKLVISLLTVAAFAVACKPSEEKSTQQQIDDVKAETKEAAQDMKDYTFAQKTEFTERMKNQLAEINQELDLISAQIEKSNDAVKAEAKPKLQTMREQTARLNKQLDEVRNATESTWDSVKAGSKKAYDELKDGFNQARQWVSDKIAS